MRYRLLASYQGAPYEAGVGPEESGVVLFAACPPPEVLGFEPATGHWRKQVDRADVQTLYESRPVGTFRGEPCVVLDDLTDRLHIAYLGHDAQRAEQLGYWEVDRGVFELITPRQEVTEIVEQRLPVAAPGESTPHSQAAPAAPGSPPGYGGEQANGSRPHLPSPDVLSGPDGLAPGHQALDDYLQGFPEYGGSAGQGARRPGAGGPGAGGPGALGPGALGPGAAAAVQVPAADDAPLPLEAEAMRAARKAQKDQHAQAAGQAAAGSAEPVPRAGSQPGPEAESQPGSPPVPSTPAGLSEPSSVLQSRADSAISVPSWSPQPHVPAQRPSHAEATEIPDRRTPPGQHQAGLPQACHHRPAHHRPAHHRPAHHRPAAQTGTAQTGAPQRPTGEPSAPQPAARQPVAPQPAAPQPAAPQPAAPQPAAPQPPVPQPGTLPPASAASAAPSPVLDDAAIHGVPLLAPTGPAAQAPAGQAPAAQATTGRAPAAQFAAPYAAPVPNPPPAPSSPAPGQATVAAGSTPPGPGQSQGVSLQRGATASSSRPAPAHGSQPGAVPGSNSISNSPGGGSAPAAARGPATASGQANGAYHAVQATAGTIPPGQGLPREQFERPLAGPAAAGSYPATSAYAGSATAPVAGSGTAPAGAGVAVADPVLTVPYAPAVRASPGGAPGTGTGVGFRPRGGCRGGRTSPHRDGAGHPAGGCPLSGSSPSSLPRRASRRVPMPSMRMSTARCAWYVPATASRCSTHSRVPGTRYGSSVTRSPRTSTFSACWRPKPCGPERSARPSRAVPPHAAHRATAMMKP